MYHSIKDRKELESKERTRDIVSSIVVALIALPIVWVLAIALLVL